MESLFKIRYWDYSHKKYNVHGYICLESSLFWGVLTILMTHIVHRPIARAVLAIPAGQDILFVTAVSAVFLYDTIVCTRAALALGRSLEAMERFRRELESLQVQTSLLKMEAGDRLAAASEKLETQKGKLASLLGMSLDELWKSAGIRLETFLDMSAEERREKYAGRLKLLKALTGITAKQIRFTRNRFRSNPTAASRRYAKELAALRELFDSRNNEIKEQH